MKKLYYKALPLCVTEKASFAEASAEELRVLLALVELNGIPVTPDEVAEKACVSLSRTKASITLWESEGVIKHAEEGSNLIDEFEFQESESNRRELTALELADSIRDNNLGDLHEEIIAIIGKGALNARETEAVAYLSTELGLSSEYIVTLASHLREKYKQKSTDLTPFRLKNKAMELCNKGCTTLEELERFIEISNSDTEDDAEIRRVFGIWGRAISKSEKAYFKKWTHEFCFGSEIISEAYDIAALKTTNASKQYMDKILTSWHEAECKTLEECRKYDTTALEERAKRRSGRGGKSKTEPETPKYGNFDPNQAFLAALDRSYGDE